MPKKVAMITKKVRCLFDENDNDILLIYDLYMIYRQKKCSYIAELLILGS